MHRRLVLPPALARRPFTVAEGGAAGLSPADLRSPVLLAPFRGVRVPAALPAGLRVTCAAAALLLPEGAAFDGATAVALHDLPLPRGVDPVRPVVVRVLGAGPHPRVDGIRVRVDARRRPTPVDGGRGRLAVVPAAEAWAALATDPAFPDDELVVVADAIARRHGDLRRLAAAAERYRGRRGGARLRDALARSRTRVDSPQETRTRLLVVAAGVPEPEVNLDVHAEDGSGWLFRPDLRWLRAKVALEYDGADHLAPARRRRDIARRELADRHGWRVVVATAPDLTTYRARLVARVEDALHDQGLVW